MKKPSDLTAIRRYRRLMRFLAILFCLALASAGAVCARPPGVASGVPQALPLSPLSVATARGKKRHFSVQVARTPQEQETGLMWRRALPATEGMLFVFPEPKQANFWMRNTLIPLDLIFIRADGTIANIAPMAKPRSLDLIASKGRVIAVLEIAGGQARKQGLAQDDRVCHADLPPC